MPDWVRIQGEVVGYVSDEPKDELPDELDVVLVRVKKAHVLIPMPSKVADDGVLERLPRTGQTTWADANLPAFVLRWLGNDYRVIKQLSGMEPDEVGVGSEIEFTTNWVEQTAYAIGVGYKDDED